MKTRDIGKGYDALAEIWNSDAFNRDNGMEQHARALAFCQHKQNAIDIGCGSSGRFIDLLLREGFAVEGLDISSMMIELARKRHPDVEFHQADIVDWVMPGQYDLISAWDSIWHIPLHEHEAVLDKLFAHLTPGGVCIFTMGGLDEASEKTDATMGPEMYYSTLGIPRVLELIAGAGCVCRHLEYDQYPELHAYLIVQRC